MQPALMTPADFSKLFQNSMSPDSEISSKAINDLYILENDSYLHAETLLTVASSHPTNLPTRLAAFKVLFKKVKTRLDLAAGRQPLDETSRAQFQSISDQLERLRQRNENRILQEGVLRLLALFEICKIQHCTPSFLAVFGGLQGDSSDAEFLRFFGVFAEIYSEQGLNRKIKIAVKRALKDKEETVFKYLEGLVVDFTLRPGIAKLEQFFRLAEALSLFKIDLLSHPSSMIFIFTIAIFSFFKADTGLIEKLFLNSNIYFGQYSEVSQSLLVKLLQALGTLGKELELSQLFKRSLRLLDPILECSELSMFLLSESSVEVLQMLLSPGFDFGLMVGPSLVGLTLALELARILAAAGDAFRSAILLRNVAENYPFFLFFRNRQYKLVMDSVHFLFESAGYDDLDELANVIEALKEAWMGDLESCRKMGQAASFNEHTQNVFSQIERLKVLGFDEGSKLESSSFGLLFDLECLFERMLPVSLPPRLGSKSAVQWFQSLEQISQHTSEF